MDRLYVDVAIRDHFIRGGRRDTSCFADWSFGKLLPRHYESKRSSKKKRQLGLKRQALERKMRWQNPNRRYFLWFMADCLTNLSCFLITFGRWAHAIKRLRLSWATRVLGISPDCAKNSYPTRADSRPFFKRMHVERMHYARRGIWVLRRGLRGKIPETMCNSLRRPKRMHGLKHK